MNESGLLVHYQLVAGLLFAIGAVGFIVRRNMIVMFLCVEMMLQGVSLSLVAWGRYHGSVGGQLLVIFIIAVAACEAGIALALVLMLCRRTGTLDAVSWQDLREDGLPPHSDARVVLPEDEEPEWPRLTPAGIEPEPDEEEELHRSRV